MDEYEKPAVHADNYRKKNWVDYSQLHYGHHPESLKQIFPYNQINPQLPYYFCQTGFSKEIYTYKLGVPGDIYCKLCEFVICPQLETLLGKHGFTGVSYMLADSKKTLGILFQPTDRCSIHPLSLAELIDQTVQSIYETRFPHGTGRYCNTTALSASVNGVEGVRNGYLQTEKLRSSSFFRMTPGTMTSERLATLKNHATYREVISLTRSLCQSCAQGEDAKVLALSEKLFFDSLKHSYDMELVRDALSYIKQFLAIRLSVHLPKEDIDLTTLCSASSYIIIEECHEAILPVMTKLCHTVYQSGTWSDTVVYAAYFLRSNLEKDVSLQEIAAFADATPAYLSNLFHQQTGITIKQYQRKIRMEQACHLLHTTQDKVADIAAKTGFIDRRYFTRIFKDTFDMTPQEYRAQNHNDASQ